MRLPNSTSVVHAILLTRIKNVIMLATSALIVAKLAMGHITTSIWVF
ncbi:MAG: hypothetical protein JW871_01760 [Endomicrobiales bacterium]|nr:hypothetical protein [Endomicrobiales bacterium]